MTKPIRVIITGPNEGRTDAPTVEDLLGQIKDFVDVLHGVEKAAQPERTKHLVWRVTDATMNSPITLELTPYGEGPVAEIAQCVDVVERAVADGMRALHLGNARPKYFTEAVLEKTRKIHARVMNGLSDTALRFDGTIESADIVIDRKAAISVETAMEKARAIDSIPYRELGSVEGYVTKPELDGKGRAILRFKSRLNGAEIKAYADGEAFRQVEALRLSDVWDGARVRVYGLIIYKTLGQIEHINATGIEVLDRDSTLPSIDDILDPTFTGHLTSEEFIARQRGYDA